jgi:diguanylate cyclase (GGDEF)-like protein/PAS domain S-box-containing protein
MKFFNKSYLTSEKLERKDNVTYLPPSETILDNITNGFFIIDCNWKIVYTNKEMEKFVNKERKELIGQNIWKVLPQAIGTDFYKFYHKAMEERVTVTFEEYFEPTNEWLEVRVIPTEEGIIGYAINITERKLYEQTIEHLAFYDQLTNLPNRILLEKKLNQLIDKSEDKKQSFALIYMDIDRFKYINDSLGHIIGEKLILRFAERLVQIISSQGFIARLGGDEFAVILNNTIEKEEIYIISEKIITKVKEEPFFVDDYELFVTVSLGMSVFPQHGEDCKTLMKNSDIAVNHAKDMGKSKAGEYNPIMDIYSYKRLSLENDLRKAINENKLELHFQPKVKVSTGEIIGAEALIRWNHPDWGMLTPADIIPIAEETGLIHSLSNWVTRKVCLVLNSWQNEGLNLVPISINISADRFISADFVPNITRQLEETKLDGKWLEIEITETSILDNQSLVEKTINELNYLNVRVSLDDFGTGYSSLSYLTRYKIHVLKIDKSFIQDVSVNSSNSTVVKSIIQLAHGLGMSVVAEGVETPEQLQFLKQQECDEIQGYIFSRPVPVSDLLKMIRNRVLKPKVEKQSYYENKRNYFRVELYFPMSSQMTIKKFRDKDIELGRTEILVEDIGLGGLRFISHLLLSVNHEIIFEFEIEILGEVFNLKGRIVWKEENEEGIYRYGVEFLISESERELLAKTLNNLSLQIRKSPLVPNCRLVQSNKYSYIKNQIKKNSTTS